MKGTFFIIVFVLGDAFGRTLRLSFLEHAFGNTFKLSDDCRLLRLKVWWRLPRVEEDSCFSALQELIR